MVNPHFSGIFEGFKIELMEGDSSIIRESISFSGNVEIYPGKLLISYESLDNFKWAQENYIFKINLINPVYSTGRIFLNFTQDWFLSNPNCTIISGFM